GGVLTFGGISHTYHEESATSFTVTATVTDSGNLSSSSTTSVTVNDAPLTAGALTPPVVSEGQAFTNLTVFHFTDANPFATVSDYTAFIKVGGGSSTVVTGTPGPNGQIIANLSGGFDVQMSGI